MDVGSAVHVLYVHAHKTSDSLGVWWYPSLGTNMSDGITTVRANLNKKQHKHNLGGFLTLVQDCRPEALIKQSRAARLS